MNGGYGVATIARALVVSVLAIAWYQTWPDGSRLLLVLAFTADLFGLGVCLAVAPRRTTAATVFGIVGIGLDGWLVTARESGLSYLATACAGIAGVCFTAAMAHALVPRGPFDPPPLRVVLPSLVLGTIAVGTVCLTFSFLVLSGAGGGRAGIGVRMTINHVDQAAFVVWTLAAVAHVVFVRRAQRATDRG